MELVLWDDLLSATGHENTFERILQCSSGCHGDGSTLSRSGSPDPGLPQLRSEAGTAISRGNSLNRWRRRYDVAGNNRFPLALAYALVISRDGTLCLPSPVLVAPERVPDRIWLRFGHRFAQFDREFGRVYWVVRHRSLC